MTYQPIKYVHDPTGEMQKEIILEMIVNNNHAGF